MIDEPGTANALTMIRARMPMLSPQHQRIAKAILADVNGVAGLTITQLAKRLDVPNPAVTRFCHAIGLASYASLREQLAVATALGQGDDDRPAWAVLGDLGRPVTTSEVLERVGYVNAIACRLTVGLIDPQAFEGAVRAIRAARRLLTFGVGSSQLPAIDAAFRLRLLGLQTNSFSDIHAALMWSSLFEADDVVLAVSRSGRTREVLELIDDARSRNATVILITSDRSSPAARAAEYCLLMADHEATPGSTAITMRAAASTVVDCLFVALAYANYSDAAEAGHRMQAAVREHHV